MLSSGAAPLLLLLAVKVLCCDHASPTVVGGFATVVVQIAIGQTQTINPYTGALLC